MINNRSIKHFLYVFFVFSLFFFISYSKPAIHNRPIQTFYNQYGFLSTFQLQFYPEQTIFSTDQIVISLSQQLQSSPAIQITYLLTDQYNYQIAQGNIISLTDIDVTNYALTPLSLGSNSTYVIDLGSATPLDGNMNLNNIIGKQWLKLQIILQESDVHLIVYGYAKISIISSLSANFILSQSNLGFQYYHIESNSVHSSLLNLNVINGVGSVTSYQTVSQKPGQVYPVYMTVQTTVNYQQPVTINFEFTDLTQLALSSITSANVNSLTAAQNTFQFMGSCNFICTSSYTCIFATSCVVSDFNIKVTVPYLTTGNTYLFQFYMVNPIYIETTNLLVWLDFDEMSTTMDSINVVQSFAVNPITISTDQMKLFWKIPYSTVQTQMQLGIYMGGGVNSIQIGFKINQITPIGMLFEVVIYVGSSDIIIQSVDFNLPTQTTTPKIFYIFPNLYIQNITSLTKINYRYWVAFRTQYALGDNVNPLGSVDINIMNQATYDLFAPLVINTAKSTLPYYDYHDTAGFNAGNNADTMIVSAIDNTFANSTSQALKKLVYQNSFVGIDPQIMNQQLVFLMQVQQSQMSSGSATENYQTKIFLNPNVFTTMNTQGLDFVSYNSTDSQWYLNSSSCYVDQAPNPTNQIYMCQKFEDHVYGNQIDNFYESHSYYGVFRFVCGNGLVVQCVVPPCTTQCNMFKGKNGVQGGGGAVSIRGINFTKSYQSPIKSNLYNLDFIVAFYNGGVLVSSSIINAYTVSSSRLSKSSITLINTYNDGTNYNTGSRIPTMLRYYGQLSLAQYNYMKPDTIIFYLPNSVAINDFIQNEVQIGCSLSCSAKKSYTSSTSIQNWNIMKSVKVTSIPQLTSAFSIYLPIQTVSSVLSIYVAFSSNNNILRIYRYGGSSINQSFISPLSSSYLFTVQVPATLWIQPAAWVLSSIATYSQSISLSQIASTSMSTTILMNTSQLPYFISPSVTFSITNIQIFTQFTSIMVGTPIKNTSCIDFSYSFQGKIIQIGHCYMFSNDNSTNNQITIYYPLYPPWLGSSLPFQDIFAYAYSGENGGLQAFRTQTNAKSTIQACTTNKLTQYNLYEIGTQLDKYYVTIKPIMMSASTFTQLQISLQLPQNIQVVLCTIQQVIFMTDLLCTVVSQTSNITIIQLGLPTSVTQLNLIQFNLNIKNVQTGAVTLSANPMYNLKVYIPNTDIFSQQTVYGVGFTPFKGLSYSCTNSFTFQSVPYNNSITITNQTVDSIGLNFESRIFLEVEFSLTKNSLIKQSHLQIIFSNTLLDQSSFCYFNSINNNISFMTYAVTAGTTLVFYPFDDIQDFTTLATQIYCENIKFLTLAPTVKLQWYDDNANIAVQQSVITTLLLPSNILSFPTAGTGSILQKLYQTAGYSSQYQIQYNIAISGTVEGYIDLSTYTIDSRILTCTDLATNLNILCYFYNSNTIPINQIRTKILYFKLNSVSPNIQISIYPILQQNTTPLPQTITTLIIYNTVQYLIPITDSSPSIIINKPIIITTYSLSPSPTIVNSLQLTMNYYFNGTSVTSQIYLLLDELFYSSTASGFLATSGLTCYINLTLTSCSFVQANIIKISSYAYTSSLQYELIVDGLAPNFQIIQIDPNNIYFKLFVLDSTFNVIYQSCFHGPKTWASTVMTAFLNLNISQSNFLIWHYSSGSVSSSQIIYQIYIGYYSESIILQTGAMTPFAQQFYLTENYTYYVFDNLLCKLGYNSFNLFVAATSSIPSTILSDILYFGINSSSTAIYDQVYPVQIAISNAKCYIKAEYSIYTIYQNGITLPIKLDFSNCRPIQNLTIGVTLNSTSMFVDTSLSNLVMNATNYIGYLFLRHSSSDSTLRNFSANFILTGTYSSSFGALPAIKIQMTAPLIGSPQGTQPILQSLNSSSINLTLQCSHPSAIYWVSGQYPTAIGLTYGDIQTRLLNGTIGLKSSIMQYYLWGDLIYGLDYVTSANIDKSIVINNLEGNHQYNFKYFCVNEAGVSSGGNIYNFTTPVSNYSLIKLIIGYSSRITYDQNNKFACSISETMIIPYEDVYTSTGSNCINISTVYYPAGSSLVYDSFDTKNNLYLYFYYINTLQHTTSNIQSTIKAKLMNDTSLMSSMSMWSSFKTQPLINSYTPILPTPNYQCGMQSISIAFNVSLINSYIVVALMSTYFDSTTMAVPQNYFIKQGKFSSNTNFDKVFMNFTSGFIQFNFTGLSASTNYSLFYFITVDDGAINAKYSGIQYMNVLTYGYLQIDLFQLYSLQVSLWLAIIILILAILN